MYFSYVKKIKLDAKKNAKTAKKANGATVVKK